MLRALLSRPAGIAAAFTRAASKKAGGSGGKSRTSNAQFLGVKIFGDQFAKAGATIIRQRGVRYSPGENVGIGRDHTLFALKSGYVDFSNVRLPKERHFVHVRVETPEEHLARMRGKSTMRAAKAARRPNPYLKLQAGVFASRGAQRTPAEQAA